MDPRHPETAIPRIKELYDQYMGVLSRIETCTTSAKLAELEREGTLVVQELFLVTPRLHEALMLKSRLHRQAMSRGLLEKCVKYPQKELEKCDNPLATPVEKPVEKSLHRVDFVTDIENPYAEIAVHEAKPEEYIEKPRKKTAKKKAKK